MQILYKNTVAVKFMNTGQEKSVQILKLFSTQHLYIFPLYCVSFQTNGTGLHEFELTSGDQAIRSHNSSSSINQNSTTQQQSDTLPSTQPLETKTFPAELGNTLEHIVGQLDILTQVSINVKSLATKELYVPM